MSTTVSDGRQSRGGEIPGDWERWLAAQGGDNEERLQRLRRGLRPQAAETAVGGLPCGPHPSPAKNPAAGEKPIDITFLRW